MADEFLDTLLGKSDKQKADELLEKIGKPRQDPNTIAIDGAYKAGKISKKKRDELKKATKKANSPIVSKGQKNARQTLRGGVSVAEKAKTVKGTWEYSVDSLRKRLNIKEGSREDQLLKSALWIHKRDNKISPQDFADVAKSLQTPSGRRDLESRVNAYREVAQESKIEELPFTKESLERSIAQGIQVVEGKSGEAIDLEKALRDWQGLGLSPVEAKPETQDEQTARERGQQITFTGKYDVMSKEEQDAEMIASFSKLGKDAAGLADKPLEFLLGGKGSLPESLTRGARKGTLEFVADAVADYARVPFNAGRTLDPDIPIGDRFSSLANLAFTTLPFIGPAIFKGISKVGSPVVEKLIASFSDDAFKSALKALPLAEREAVKYAAETIEQAAKDPDLAEGFGKAIDDAITKFQQSLDQDTPNPDVPGAIDVNALPKDPQVDELPGVQFRNPDELGVEFRKPEERLPKAEIPESTTPAELQGKVDAPILQSAVEKAKARKAARQAARDSGQINLASGFDPEIIYDAVDDAIIFIGEKGMGVEAAIRSAIKSAGLGDDAFDEVRKGVNQEFGIKETEIPTGGTTRKDVQGIRQKAGIDEFQKSTVPLEDTAARAAGIDVDVLVKDILDSPRAMNDAERYASTQRFNAELEQYDNLANQLNKAIEEGDNAKVLALSDQIDATELKLSEFADALDKSGAEAGRNLRAIQLEQAKATDPASIRYRHYKANPNPTKAEKAKIDGLIADIEKLKAENQALSDSVANNRKVKAEQKVKTVRRPRKVEEAIKKNDADFAEWQKRWAKAGTGGKQGGATTIPLAMEGAYYIAKGSILKGVKSLDDITKAIRSNGLGDDVISDNEIAEMVSKAVDDVTPKRSPKKEPTIGDLRNEINNKLGRAKTKRKAPPRSQIKDTNRAKSAAAKVYYRSLDALSKELDEFEKITQMLDGFEPGAKNYMEIVGKLPQLMRKVNRGRGYGKDIIQVGDIAYQSPDVIKLRDKLDKVKAAFRFDEQAINAPGPSYENIIKNIEDLEASNLTGVAKRDELRRLMNQLNTGRRDGESMFRHGKDAISDPKLVDARARLDGKLNELNTEIAKQKARANREAMSRVMRALTDFGRLAGALKTTMLSGEAGFIGRQAGIALHNNPKIAKAAFRDMLNSKKAKAFDYVQASLKAEPGYEVAKKAGLEIAELGHITKSDDDFTYSLFTDWAEHHNKIVRSVGKPLDKYSEFNERMYTSFVNRVRMDWFNDLVASASRRGPLTDETLEGLATIVNDMTGRSKVKPKYAGAVSAINHVAISARYYLSRLRVMAGAPMWTKDPVVRWEAMKVYGRYMRNMGTLAALVNYTNERFNTGVTFETDPRSTDFSKVVFPNKNSLELDAGMRPFVNYGARMLTSFYNDLALLEEKDRIPTYISRAGNEAREDKPWASKVGMTSSFIQLRSNPLVRMFLTDYVDGKNFGEDANIYTDAAFMGAPIQAKQPIQRLDEMPPIDNAIAFLLSFFGIGGDNLPIKREDPEKDSTGG